MLNRPWFSRAWIFQEAAFSQRPIVLLGLRSFDLRILDYLLIVIASIEGIRDSRVLRTRGAHTLRCVQEWRQGFYHNRRIPPTFLHVLERLALSLDASDGRDQVYAFLALQDPNVEHITADYSLQTSHAYTVVSALLAATMNSLAILGVVRGAMHPSILPTWAVDWRLNRSTQGTSFDNRKTSFNACQGYPYRTSSPPSHLDKILRVRGRIIDEVEVVCPITYNENAPVEQLRLLEITESLGATAALAGYSITEISQHNWLKRVLAVITAYDGHLDPADDIKIDEMLRAYLDFDSITHRDEALENRIDLEHALQQLTRKIHIYRGKKVFRGARTSLLGLGACRLCRGDLIYILHGSKVPIVLRKHWLQYTVVGQCYYENWMYGDLVDWKEDEADIFELV